MQRTLLWETQRAVAGVSDVAACVSAGAVTAVISADAVAVVAREHRTLKDLCFWRGSC